MKKIIRTSLLLLVVFLLSGCMKINMKVVIMDKEHASIEMKMLFQEEIFTQYGASTDDFYSSIKEEEQFKDWEITETKETIDGGNYIGVILTSPKNSDMIKEMLDGLQVTEKDGKKTYTLMTSPGALDSEDFSSEFEGMGYSIDQMKKLGFEMTVSFQMPCDITESSVGEVDGDTVTIDLLALMNGDYDGQSLRIVAAEGGSSSNLWLYLGIGVAVVAILAFIIIKKYNKKTIIDSVSDTPVEPVTSDPLSSIETVAETVESVEETATSQEVEETTEEVVDVQEEVVTQEATNETASDDETSEVENDDQENAE